MLNTLTNNIELLMKEKRSSLWTTKTKIIKNKRLKLILNTFNKLKITQY